MPGMMDTVLNLGFNPAVESALALESGNPSFAAETHRRFADQYREVVLGGQAEPLPEDPWMQLRAAVIAVFDSWYSPRAQLYRHNRRLSEDGGTAVTIQAMVFGNLDDRSGTGVLFSRNPITGEPPAWGEWLARGQGEEVVSGRFTPQPLDALRLSMPEVHAQLVRAAAVLEADARDMQDIEFTVESERLWLLQSRTAKRSPQAAVRAAVAFAEASLISRETAVRRVSLEQARHLPKLRLASQATEQEPLAAGESACPGVASGRVVTDIGEAEARAQLGERVILARATTSPGDLPGIIAAQGVMTEQGGATSHAAVVSRELGRPCIVGCGTGTVTALSGREVTMDGTAGRVWAGDVAVAQIDTDSNDDIRKLIEWSAPLIPLRLLPTDEAPADAIDLDTAGEDWRSALESGLTVRGRIFDTEEGIRAAMSAGVRAIVVRDRLAASITCLHAASTQDQQAGAGARDLAARGAPIPELTLLRLLALKGRTSAGIIAEALSLPVGEALAAYAGLCAEALCTQTATDVQLTHSGRERLASLLAEERARADAAAAAAVYEEFLVFNVELKQIISAWQLTSDGQLNDHRDGRYDQSVLQRLADLHQRAGPLLLKISELSPRLSIYRARLARAEARVRTGDHAYVAKIIADSYHTVWFELHEELLALVGRKREV
jgi:pyruvate,orthophosphate dikinase